MVKAMNIIVNKTKNPTPYISNLNIIKAKRPETLKAIKAVNNQPKITLSTPLTLKTALSLPQALSLKEVAIATMKVTKVVERGNFIEVAKAIRELETERLTEARTKSKAGGFAMSISFLLGLNG
jgi:hypothetical protein